MKSVTMLGVVGIGLLASFAVACSGSDGAPGPAGPAGSVGTPGAQGGQGATGATGPAGTGTDPSVSVVVPRVGLLDREHDVVVTAEAVKFDASATLDFGQGVTVSNPQVVSPTTMLVHLKIDKAAAVGAHDLKITVGGKTLTGTKVYDVEAPLAVSVALGKAEQGGLVEYDVTNRDLANAFDPGSTASGLFTTTPNLLVKPVNGIFFFGQVDEVTGTRTRFPALIDATAPTTPAQLTLANSPGGVDLVTFLSAPDAMKIATRIPVAVTLGTPLTGQLIGAPYGTALFKITVPANTIVDASITAPGAKLWPNIWILPTSGKISDWESIQAAAGVRQATPLATFAQTTAGDVYVLTWDYGALGGSAVAADYGFTVTTTKQSATAVAETAGHTTGATAQDLGTLAAGAALIVTGKTTSATDVHAYKVTLAANQRIQGIFQGGADSLLVIGDSTLDETVATNVSESTSNAGGPGKIDASGSFTATTAGTYYIAVKGQAGGTTPTGNYSFAIR